MVNHIFKDKRFGLFVHYVPFLTVDKTGRRSTGIDDLADNFDLTGFLNEINQMKIEYLIFTAWHSQNNILYPSNVMKKYRNGHFSERDLIGELIAGCKKINVDVILYTHPRDGMEFSEEDKISTGWGAGRHENGWDPNPDTFDFQKWNDFLVEMYNELVQLYGKDISGIFLDEGSPAGDSFKVVDYVRLNDSIKKISPNIVTIQNFYGDTYGCDMGIKEFGPMWNEFRNVDGQYWPGFVNPVCACISENWMADKKQGDVALKYKKEDLFRYTVLQAATNRNGGGIAWAAGPYKNGGWESDVCESIIYVGEKVDSISKSIRNTKPSLAFPTFSGTTINDLQWGVSTTSMDNKTEYIHILKEVENKKIAIGAPKTNAKYSFAYVLNPQLDLKVDFEQDDDGNVDLIFNGQFDPIDTVVCLDIKKTDEKIQEYIMNDTDKSIFYFGSWEYSRWERCCGDYESDLHQTKTDGDYFEFSFTGNGFDLIAPGNKDFGTIDIFIDHCFVSNTSGYSETYNKQQVVYGCRNLHGASHVVKIIKTSGEVIQIDAIRIIL